METLNLPGFAYSIQYQGEQPTIFDHLRKKYIHLTPEEWVRQHMLHYLVGQLAYPKGLIKVESKTEKSREDQQRADIIVYRQDGTPWMIVECKSSHTPIVEATLRQVMQYNNDHTPFLLFTNGITQFCYQYHVQKAHYVPLPYIPSFQEAKELCSQA